MSYRNDVAEAKRLIKRSEDDQWRLSELTYTVVEAGTARRQWAKDIEISEFHSRMLYLIWDKWGAFSKSQRPKFWDCYRKVQFKDDDATNDSHRADTNLKNATPAAVAKIVAANPDMARAIARNTEARQAVEEEGLYVRQTHHVDLPGTPEQAGRQAAHNIGKAIGQTGDEATRELRQAARIILEAVLWKEEYGIEDPDAEKAAIMGIEKALRIYRASAPITDADQAFLAEYGIEL